MAKTIKAVAAPVAPVVKPIDAAVAIKAAQTEACTLIAELSDLDNKREKVGEKLTAAIIIIMRNTAAGNERDVAMRPLLDATVKARANGDKNYGEKEAKRYLANYLTNARKAIDAGLPTDSGSLSVRKVTEAAKEANKGKAPAKRRGRIAKGDLEKAMDYVRPMLAGLKDAASATGAHSQAVEFLLWAARECKYEAVYNGQHKTLVVTVK